MVSPNFGGGHQMEMQFGGPPMGMVRQPPPTNIPPPQTNIQQQGGMNHNPPPWIKPVESQQMEVDRSMPSSQDMDTQSMPSSQNIDTTAEPPPIEEVKMDICDTWEQEKVQRLTEEVEKFEQEVMNIEKNSKAKSINQTAIEPEKPVIDGACEPQKLAVVGDIKQEKLSVEDDSKSEKLAAKIDTKPEKLVDDIGNVPKKQACEENSKPDKLAEDKPDELAEKVHASATETLRESVDDCKTGTERFDAKEVAFLDKVGEDHPNKDTRKPEEKISKESPTGKHTTAESVSTGGIDKAMAEDHKVDHVTGDDLASNVVEDKVDHMLEPKFDSGGLEQQPGEEENKETKCDKGEEHQNVVGDDTMDLQDSSSETDKQATGEA